MENLKEYLLKISEQKARCDNEDFEVNSWAGGNIDDAYNMGIEDGEILFARALLDMINGANNEDIN